MFQCGGAVCAGNPFSMLLTSGGGDNGSSLSSSSSSASSELISIVNAAPKNDRSDSWSEYVHLRAENKWASQRGKLQQLLMDISLLTDGDPVFTDDDCVLWKGPTVDGEPMVTYYDPELQKEVKESVSRTMAFLFVDEESYDAVMAHTPSDRVGLENLCNNLLCVNVRHLVIPD